MIELLLACTAFAIALTALRGTLARAQSSPAVNGPPPPVAPAVITRDDAGQATVRAIKLPAPLKLDGGRSPYEQISFTEATEDKKRMVIKTASINPFSQALAASTYYAGMNTTIVTVDADTSVWLVGVNRTQLTAADFAFV